MSEKNRQLLVAMAHKGWTSRQLSQESGVAESTISRLLNNSATPHQRTQQLLADALGVKPDSLFREASNAQA